MPKNFDEWILAGPPLAPDALNDGKAGFPEQHNLYTEPGSIALYRPTGEFPDGTIMFNEL